MKKTVLTITLLGLFMFINTSQANSPGTTLMKACTFHGETYQLVQPDLDCPVPQDIVLETHTIIDGDPKHQAHNPDCFDFHFVYR